MDFLEQLNWRYSTKQFDETPVSKEDLEYIMEAFRLAPSAFGIQPGRILHITSPEVREKLSAYVPEGPNKQRVLHAPELLVLAGNIKLDDQDVDDFIQNTSNITGTPVTDLEGMAGFLKGFFGGLSPEDKSSYTHKQVMLALGFLLSAAAMRNIDVGNLGGFDSKGFNEILNLSEKGLTSVFVVALGHRHPDDSFAKYKKVRYSLDEIYTKI